MRTVLRTAAWIIAIVAVVEGVVLMWFGAGHLPTYLGQQLM